MRNVRRLELPSFRRKNQVPGYQVFLLAILPALFAFNVGCASFSQGSASNASSTSGQLALAPDSASVTSLEQLQFTARISGTANTAVTWSASAGSISSDGLFTAPKVNSNTPVTITATGTAQPVYVRGVLETVSARASASVTVVPAGSLVITTAALPVADASTPYSASLVASGGVAPYQWTFSNGSLPSGLQLQSSTGTIAGTTALAGSYPFTAKVSDGSGHSASVALSLTVYSSNSGSGGSGSAGSGSSSSGATFDGPAELPLVYIQTAMADTPAPGAVVNVSANGDVQTALNSANCGDTIQLQAGAIFTGAFTFPAKNCNNNNWIIVRTSASDSQLPPEGTRLTPCYAGVASLPGRPAFNCTSTNKVVATLLLPSSDIGPVIFASGANYYRLIGLEITRAAGTGLVESLASVAGTGTANNIIFDRLWVHGTAQDDTDRGIWLEGGTYISAINSFFTDFHCVSVTGACTDAQAIAGGVGAPPMGPYNITNNFLEASGENVMFGGGPATGTPADIQISQNHFFKPLIWLQGQPGYVGGTNGNPFSVKNLIELKNAQRVLIDGNIMDYSWGGFSQEGFAVLITPKNQSGTGTSNLCSICEVTDVTLRYSTISHVGAGLQIANALSDNGGPALAGERYSIHDITIDDINGTLYDGPSEFAEVSTVAGSPLLQDVLIDHITAFPSTNAFVMGDTVATSGAMKNFVFTNSIVNAGTYPMWSTGGGVTNCAYYDVPITTFDACFTASTFSNNAFIASPPSDPANSWPAGNSFPASTAAVQFVNYNGGNGGNYELQPTSPYINKATDGTNLGANVAAIDQAIEGVE